MPKPLETPETAKYLRVIEVAAYLNVSPRSIYDLISAGELTAVKFGQGRKGLRVLSESVLKFEAERTADAAS
jgi:excisionase family DNA binding protein